MGNAHLSSFFAKFESDDLGLGLPPMLKPTTDGKRSGSISTDSTSN